MFNKNLYICERYHEHLNKTEFPSQADCSEEDEALATFPKILVCPYILYQAFACLKSHSKSHEKYLICKGYCK